MAFDPISSINQALQGVAPASTVIGSPAPGQAADPFSTGMFNPGQSAPLDLGILNQPGTSFAPPPAPIEPQDPETKLSQAVAKSKINKANKDETNQLMTLQSIIGSQIGADPEIKAHMAKIDGLVTEYQNIKAPELQKPQFTDSDIIALAGLALTKGSSFDPRATRAALTNAETEAQRKLVNDQAKFEHKVKGMGIQLQQENVNLAHLMQAMSQDREMAVQWYQWNEGMKSQDKQFEANMANQRASVMHSAYQTIMSTNEAISTDQATQFNDMMAQAIEAGVPPFMLPPPLKAGVTALGEEMKMKQQDQILRNRLADSSIAAQVSNTQAQQAGIKQDEQRIAQGWAGLRLDSKKIEQSKLQFASQMSFENHKWDQTYQLEQAKVAIAQASAGNKAPAKAERTKIQSEIGKHQTDAIKYSTQIEMDSKRLADMQASSNPDKKAMATLQANIYDAQTNYRAAINNMESLYDQWGALGGQNYPGSYAAQRDAILAQVQSGKMDLNGAKAMLKYTGVPKPLIDDVADQINSMWFTSPMAPRG